MTRTPPFLLLLLAFTGSGQAADDASFAHFIDEAGIEEHSSPVRERAGWSPAPKILIRPMAGVSDDFGASFPNAEVVVADGLEEAMTHAADAHAIIGFCDAELVGAAPKLVWVQIYWAGVEHCLENDAIGSGRIVLTNMQKMSSPMIGEHAIAMMLSLTRGLTPFAKMMSDGSWRREFARNSAMTSVDGKTLLVVGLGGIGKQVARRAKDLGMRVVATRNSSREGPEYVDYVGLADELHALAGEADVIVNALPLTPATEGLLDRAFFAQVKPGSYFINVGRGRTVVTDALLAALENGRVAGAGLDVTDPEPLPAEHALWQLPNVIITPHVAGFGGSRRWHALLVRENLRRFLEGGPLLNVVDPERGY